MIPALLPLLGPDTPLITALNGIPWWFCHGMSGLLAGRRLTSVDRNHVLEACITADRIIGCVVHGGYRIIEPGCVQHMPGAELIIGEARGHVSERVECLVSAFRDATIVCDSSPRIQDAIWHKLLGNLSMNPVAALTGATLKSMADSPRTRALLAILIGEGMAVGDVLGLDNGSSIDERIELGALLGEFKTSMLQDLEKGRPMEIDSIISAVCELARIADVDTPALDTVLALINLRAQSQVL
jgi:2-dehydropantoate 2-reductase